MFLQDWVKVKDVNQTRGKRKSDKKDILKDIVNKPLVFSNTQAMVLKVNILNYK